LDEACGGEGLASPESEGLSSEPGLYDAEAVGSDALLHLAEVGLAGGSVLVSAGFSEVGIASETFD